MPTLGVNIDHVATLRQQRLGEQPDTMSAAVHAEMGGADGITIHLREDRRHIQDYDLRNLRQSISTRLNMEMAATAEMVAIAVDVRPDQCTLVPERRQELTTEGGLDLVAHGEAVRGAIERLQGEGIPVSLFIDPEVSVVEEARRLGAQAVELHTGCYAEDPSDAEVARLKDALGKGLEAGLTVHAGHGLDYNNAHRLAQIPGFTEFNIGHSIISRAIFVGLTQAVREMKDLVHYLGRDPQGVWGTRAPKP